MRRLGGVPLFLPRLSSTTLPAALVHDLVVVGDPARSACFEQVRVVRSRGAVVLLGVRRYVCAQVTQPIVIGM